MPEKNYDIIVIGAGCGGLSAALCAAKKRKKVLLLEKHNSPGGFTSSFVRGRFEFDISLHQLCGYSTDTDLGETRRLLDAMDVSNKIQWAEIPEAYRLITKARDGSVIDVTMPFGVENFINAMEYYVPGSKTSMTKLFQVAKEIAEATEDLSSVDGNVSFRQAYKILKKHGNFVRTAPYSVNEVLNALDIPQKAQSIFTAYWVYLGVDCDRLSFTHYISMVYNYLKFGAVVPKKRSYEMSMALAGEFEDCGGEIRYNSTVSRITFTDGKASGVILKYGEKISCNHIICTCSPNIVYSKMMKKSDVPASASKRTNARTLGARGACVYLGLNRSPDDLGIKNYSYFISNTADTAEQYQMMKKIETNTCQSAVCLNIANPECSPEGTTILCLTTLFTDNCWADVAPEEYFNEKDIFAARLITSFEEATGIIIHNNIEEIEVATPVTFARYTNSPQGVVYGYQADDWDSIIPRIMTEAVDCDTPGLRFCGGWGAQLSGVSSVIASGRNAAYATLNDIETEGGLTNE